MLEILDDDRMKCYMKNPEVKYNFKKKMINRNLRLAPEGKIVEVSEEELQQEQNATSQKNKRQQAKNDAMDFLLNNKTRQQQAPITDFKKDLEEIDKILDEALSDDDDEGDNEAIQNLMKNKSKLEEGHGSMDPKDLEHIQKYLSRNSRCPPLEILMLIPILYVASFALVLIPGFVPLNTFQNITKIEQPICAPVDHTVPGLPRFLIPSVISLFAFFIVKVKGDILVATFSALLLAFDPTFVGMMGQSPSASIMAFCVLLAYNITHNILLKDKVYGLSWFFNLLVGWFIIAFVPFFRPEGCGSLVGLYVSFLISCFSEIAKVFQSRVKMFVQLLKMIFVTYICGIPLFAFVLYLRNRNGYVAYNKRDFMFALFKNEIIERESWVIYVFIAIGLLFIKKAKYNYISMVPLIQFIVGTIASIFMPYESPGNTIPMKLFFIKLHLMLASSLILSKISNKIVQYGLPIGLILISGFFKLKSIAQYIIDHPEIGKELFKDLF
ncbi:hypothetical protein TRFO_06645 [Tritrichomonas foetus]|uniref:Uncharacterized protein n=1 Tax=Tritrichomonas foetus TaxID=1144522 RepID=A0A1J4K0Z9_9EUKA|nr:hypothetical protein TRFO_06645 [Tritrichomonas foetus]|eukprot:OHT03420.1 hypothetical protein TRFO_06645 [Tritrichomonas foetus]